MTKKKTVCLLMCLCVLLQMLQPVSVRAEETQTESTEEIMEEVSEVSIEDISEDIMDESTEENVEENTETSTEEIVEEIQDTSAEDGIAIITEENTEEIPSTSIEDNIVVITEETSDEVMEIAEGYTHADENGNVFTYTLDENSQAVIHGITLSGAVLIVPAEMDGYVVASVANANTCVVANPDVYIPELTISCTSVAPNAFAGLKIGTLTLAEGVADFPGFVGTDMRWYNKVVTLSRK